MEYPTLFTAGTRCSSPAAITSDPEEVDGPRSRPPVLVRHRRHQRVRGRVDGRRHQHLLHRARHGAGLAIRTIYALRYFGGFVPWVFRDIALDRETEATAWPAIGATAKSDAQSTPSFRYFPATGGSITYNKTALWLNTLERWLGWPTLQRILSTYFARWKFKHPEAGRFLRASPTRSPGSDLGWFFDQVYRSSNVFDYGVQESEEHARRRRSSGRRVVVRRYGEAIFPGRRAGHVRERRADDRALGRRRSLEAVRLRSAGARAVPAQVDPEPRAAARRELHQQLEDADAASRGTAATKWSLKWMVWLQDCLLSWAALA